ncbi:endo-1,4-beta-xylanase [Egbenema bharatensis]|uniref:endo-1,4-beta-xylanase n=1 Tax=Egbenema bharatensis TaxID=3463334 RepID=UPI003A8956A7
MNRRFFLQTAATVLGTQWLSTAKPSWTHPLFMAMVDPALEAAIPLSDRAAAKGLLYGAASTARKMQQDAAFASAVARECNLFVPENDLKWKALRPSPEQFDFTRGDWLAAFAQAHGMQFRGHTCVWHEALPEWFDQVVTHQNAEQVLTEHIRTVVGHYAGQMHSWDVVNEAIDPVGQGADGLRDTPWKRLLGADYIDIAFHTAAAADPNALLVLNEYDLDYDIPRDAAKREAILRLLRALVARGVPVHALGMQAHLRAAETDFDPVVLRDFLRQVADLGLKIMVTELDVVDQDLPRALHPRDLAVAHTYQSYLDAVLQEPAVIAVLTWGLSDRYTWLTNFRPRSDGAAPRPLPLDSLLHRKPAWSAIASAFDQAPSRLISN